MKTAWRTLSTAGRLPATLVVGLAPDGCQAALPQLTGRDWSRRLDDGRDDFLAGITRYYASEVRLD